MAERETLTVAVIGLGSAGTQHLHALASLEAVKPLPVPKRRDRCESLKAEGWSVASDIATAAQLGARLAIVASETGSHAADTKAALDAGMDVLVEKPMAVNAAEAKQLRKQAACAGRRIYVGCVLRFAESLDTFRGELPTVGVLHAVRIESRSYLPDWRPQRPYQDSYSARSTEGGVLRDLIHEIDYAGWLFGWPEFLYARVINLNRLGIESEELAQLRWQAGCPLSMELDYLTRPAVRRAVAYGEHGTIEWDGIQGSVRLALADQSPQTWVAAQERHEMFRAQANAFVKIAQGLVDPRLATADDGINALAICDAARAASSSGRDVRVRYG